MEPPTSDDTVRIEINHLRKARESLVNQRKELADFRKQNPDSDSDSETERKIYGCEEAIEAIDSAIDFKNEVICGRDFILSNDFAPGMVRLVFSCRNGGKGS
jgi:costal 2 protein